MKPISKAEGKALNKLYPQYICRTQHKRHYYIVESAGAMRALERHRQSQADRIIEVYPEGMTYE